MTFLCTYTVHLCNSGSVSPFFVQIDKIMSSIGAGIGSGLDIKEEASGEICRHMYVWVCELFGFRSNSGVLGFI